MYHPTIVEKKMEQYAARSGRELRVYSPAEVEQAVKHLNGLRDEQHRLKRALNQDEVKFIQNERALCKLWFEYWASRYAFIKSRDGEQIRFKPNMAQMIVLELWGDNEIHNREIAMIQLKARQLGVSTLTELAVLHRAQFNSNVNAVVASCDPEKSSKMAEMLEYALDKEPWWLVPEITAHRMSKGDGLIEFGRQDSGISIQHGSQVTGIARGTTPTVAHLSELAEYADPEELVDNSLLRAMHPSPKLFLILEGTAKGKRNWWHDTWNLSKLNWETGRARLRPMFLGWYVATDQYPTESFIKTRPIPADWRPMDITVAHAHRAESYVRTNTLLSKRFGSNWTMPREQMWWYEVERQEATNKGNLSSFLQELPADDVEAFQSRNVSAFSTDTVQIYSNNVKAPLGIYGIKGPQSEIPINIQPSARDIDPNKKPITVRMNLNGQSTYRYDLMPLRMDDWGSTFDPTNKMLLWEYPDPDEVYGLGIDTSDGVGQDSSVIEVIRKGTVYRNDSQICEWASAYVNAYDLWPIAYAIAGLYSPVVDGSVKQAKVVIEVNRNGESVQLELKKRGWANFHQWVRYDSKKIQPGKAHKLGWMTNGWSRPMVIDLLLKSLRDGWIDINSPYFVDEMGDLERDEDAQYLKAMRGGHDDRLMALGIVLLSLHVMEIWSGKTMVATQRKALLETAELYPSWEPAVYERDTGEGRLVIPYGDVA